MAEKPNHEELQGHIDAARDAAEEHGTIPGDDEPKFYESGSSNPEDDDQTIAPPG